MLRKDFRSQTLYPDSNGESANLNIGIQNNETVYSIDVATELQEFNNYNGALEWLN